MLLFFLIRLGVGHGTLKRKADDAAPGLTSKTEPREGFDVRKRRAVDHCRQGKVGV